MRDAKPYENRKAHFLAHETTDKRYDRIRQYQGDQGGDAQTNSIDNGTGHGEQGAESEQLHQCNIIAPESVLCDFACACHIMPVN